MVLTQQPQIGNNENVKGIESVKIHPCKEFDLCEKCKINEEINKDYYSIIFEKCDNCKSKLVNNANISEIFFFMRKWQPNIQKHMDFFINLLLTKNCGINDRDGVTDMTPLMYACRSGAAYIGDDENAVNLIKLLINKGADLNAKSCWLQMNCLQLCAFFDSYKCLEYILNENSCVGIDNPCESFNFGTALHIACMNKSVKSAHILLKYGANMDQLDSLGQKPFEYITKGDFKSNNESINETKDHIENYLFENGNLDFLKNSNSNKTETIKLNVTLKISDDAKKLLNKMNIRLNEQVIVSNKKIGYLRYCGPTKFANGIWAGIELDKPLGKHDGSLAGIRYFSCPKNHGIFCQLDKLKKFDSITKTHIPSTKYFSNNKIEIPENEIKVKRSHSHHATLHANQPVKILATPNQISTPTLQSNYGVPAFNESKTQKASSLKEESTSSMDGYNDLKLENGMKVMYQGHRAIVRYVGKTHFAEGIWIGLELISQSGKNDGSIQGIRYFECEKRHGIFVRPNKLITNGKFKKT